MKISQYTQKDFDKVYAFLLKYEKFCVNLVEEFVAEDCIVYVIWNDSEIAGVFSFNARDQIKHCIPLKTKEEIVTVGKLLIDFFAGQSYRQLFSIIGEKSGTELIKRVVNVAWNKKESRFQEYFLMENNGQTLPADEESDNPAFPPESISIKKCSVEDAKELFPLQKNYELEEVYSDHSRFKSSACLFNLERLLKNTYQLSLFVEGKPVAKGGSNASGVNYVQIGGIFTAKELREQGFAKKIVTKLVKDFADQGKKSVLFVKIENKAAVGLYKCCCFEEAGRFAIAYY